MSDTTTAIGFTDYVNALRTNGERGVHTKTECIDTTNVSMAVVSALFIAHCKGLQAMGHLQDPAASELDLAELRAVRAQLQTLFDRMTPDQRADFIEAVDASGNSKHWRDALDEIIGVSDLARSEEGLRLLERADARAAGHYRRNHLDTSYTVDAPARDEAVAIIHAWAKFRVASDTRRATRAATTVTSALEPPATTRRP